MAERRPAFLDTSVVVRYLTDDPPELAARAAAAIDSDAPLVLSEVAIVEAAYVLTIIYGVARDATVDALAVFVQRRNLRLLTLPKPLVLEALSLCRGSKRYSFADAMLWAQARFAGSLPVLSFDQRFPSEGLEVRAPG